MDLRGSKRFCVQDALDLLLDGNESEIGELDSDDDDDIGDFECHDAEFFHEEVDEHGKIRRDDREDEQHENDEDVYNDDNNAGRSKESLPSSMN